jgi:hypothetical protein
VNPVEKRALPVASAATVIAKVTHVSFIAYRRISRYRAAKINSTIER